MDAVEILLLCVVGFAVLVFLFVDSLDLGKRSKKFCDEPDRRKSLTFCDSEIKVHQIGSYLLESVEASRGERSVGAERGTEKKSPNVKNPNFETSAGERADNQGNSKSGFGNRVISEESIDDWEGIERTELEKAFGEAVVYMSYKSTADKISRDVKLQLYGLQKVALEGPCHGSQPMVWNVSARAKWTAWQKLGNMSQETAMEKYVNIVAEAKPGWKGQSNTVH